VHRLPALFAILWLSATACSPSAPAGGIGAIDQAPVRAGPTTLRSILKVEPASLAKKPLEGSGISIDHGTSLFNATLDQLDAQETARPYLAEVLPALNTDSWKVFPDGRMETTWRLRPNLTWHDGTPLDAEDFVFAWRVYNTPELGVASSRPNVLMEDTSAPDPRTLVIRWSRPYPDAASMDEDFQALPRHLLEGPFRQGDAESFRNHAFWKAQYVGLGPYRLERWEPGAFIEGVAFDGYVRGRPKIDRVIVRFMPDENTALTNLLAGEVHFATDRTIRFEQAQILKREWGPVSGGTTVLTPAQPRVLYFQTRPELSRTPALLDVRGRRAVAHAIDRQALNEGLFNGDGGITEVFITSTFPAYAELDRTITKHPFDPRRTEQLLTEMGYARGADGFFSRAGERLTVDFRQEAGDQTQREMSIITDSWRTAGIESTVSLISSTQLRDLDYRHAFSGVYSGGTSAAARGGINAVTTYRTPPGGITLNMGNYAGWSNPDYDRIHDTFLATLDQGERNRQVIQMVKMLTDELPMTVILFNYNVSAFSSAVRGADPTAFDTLINWNVHEWELR
jgi:peptide/nickel transport system substrate-binding protein